MNIAVYCGSVSGNKEQFEKGARALGTWIGEHGHTLVYGGAQGGLMGIVADAVLEHGGTVTGVLPAVESIQKRRHPGLTAYIETNAIRLAYRPEVSTIDCEFPQEIDPNKAPELSEAVIREVHQTL